MHEIQKSLGQVCYLLNQQIELRDELRGLSEKLPPLLQAQAEEFERLTGKISAAKAEFETSLRLDPSDAEARENLQLKGR